MINLLATLSVFVIVCCSIFAVKNDANSLLGALLESTLEAGTERQMDAEGKRKKTYQENNDVLNFCLLMATQHLKC